MMMAFKALLNQPPGVLQCDTCSYLLHTLLSCPAGALYSLWVFPVHIYLCLLSPVDPIHSICGPLTSVLCTMPPVPYSFVDADWMLAKYPIMGWSWETRGAGGHSLILPEIQRLVQEIVSFVKGQDSECLGLTSHVLSIRRSQFFLCVGKQSHNTGTDKHRMYLSQWHSMFKKQKGGLSWPFGHGLLTPGLEHWL